MTDSAFLAGRTRTPLQPPYGGTDALFAADRIDASTIENAEFRHCTFANVSLKACQLRCVVFVNCVFIGCYFRKATFLNTDFRGCKFIRCQFPNLSVTGCDFRYASFRDCYIDHGEIVHSLPGEPNLLADLTKNLAMEAAKAEATMNARRFRESHLQAREADARAAFTAQSQWYRNHYDSWRRVGAFARWLASRANWRLWGYGEHWMVLTRNYLLLGLLFFPAVFYILSSGLKIPAGANQFAALVLFSLDLLVPAEIRSGVIAVSVPTQVVATVESVIGVVAIGLFGTHVLRWSLRR